MSFIKSRQGRATLIENMLKDVMKSLTTFRNRTRRKPTEAMRNNWIIEYEAGKKYVNIREVILFHVYRYRVKTWNAAGIVGYSAGCRRILVQIRKR